MLQSGPTVTTQAPPCQVYSPAASLDYFQVWTKFAARSPLVPPIG